LKKSPGRMYFPLKKKQSELKEDELARNAGANLMTDTPEIANWLATVCPGEPITLGGYAYLDGARHVQVSVAMDAIMQSVLNNRREVALGYLCSPTDVFAVLKPANVAASKNNASVPVWQKLISSISGGRLLVNNARKPFTNKEGLEMVLNDGLVVAQGPNYALAKRLQHWRAMLARRTNTVSTNIAPSTATRSVVHNAQFAAAYGGMHHFKPMEIMYQETSNAVMGALLIHDVTNPLSAANPKFKLEHPQLLFSYGSFHGGIWRCGYKIDSMGEVAALIYYTKSNLGLVSAVSVAIVSGVVYVVLKGMPKPHTW